MVQKHIEYKPPGVIDRAKDAFTRLMIKLGAVLCGVVLCDAFFLNGTGLTYVRARIADQKAALADVPKVAAPAAPIPAPVIHKEPEPPVDVEREAQEIIEGKFNIPRVIWLTVAKHESGASMSMFARNFAPNKMDYVRKMTNDPHEQKWLASAHGRFQVMGYNLAMIEEKHGIRITPQELDYDPRANALAFGIIISDCWRSDRVQQPKKRPRPATIEKIRNLFGCYYGYDANTDAYANSSMAELKNELLNDITVDIRPGHEEIRGTKYAQVTREKPAATSESKKQFDNIGQLIASLPDDVGMPDGEPFIAEDRE